MAKDKVVKKLEIFVENFTKERRVTKGLFSDRLDDVLSVFMNINCPREIPLIRLNQGKKKQIGYKWEECRDGTGFDGWPDTRIVSGTIVPLRPTYHIENDLYKMLVRPEDDFNHLVQNLADVLKEKGEVDVSYKKPKLKDVLGKL